MAFSYFAILNIRLQICTNRSLYISQCLTSCVTRVFCFKHKNKYITMCMENDIVIIHIHILAFITQALQNFLQSVLHTAVTKALHEKFIRDHSQISEENIYYKNQLTAFSTSKNSEMFQYCHFIHKNSTMSSNLYI